MSDKTSFIIYIFFGVLFCWAILISNVTDDKFYMSAFSISVVFLIVGSVFFFIDSVYRYLNFGNIDYEYIILDKNAKLPDEICDDTYIKNIKKPKEMISYLTYRLENNTTKSLNISFKCLAFIDENNNTIKTYKNENISRDNKTDKKIFVVIPTYFTKDSDIIKLHNIKVLSALGNKWFIESKNGFRFKIDKSHIKTEILD